MTRESARDQAAQYTLSGSIHRINELGFFISIRNPVSGWFEVVIKTADDAIVQCGHDLSHCIYEACVSAMVSDPPQKPPQSTDTSKAGERLLNLL